MAYDPQISECKLQMNIKEWLNYLYYIQKISNFEREIPQRLKSLRHVESDRVIHSVDRYKLLERKGWVKLMDIKNQLLADCRSGSSVGKTLTRDGQKY